MKAPSSALHRCMSSLSAIIVFMMTAGAAGLPHPLFAQQAYSQAEAVSHARLPNGAEVFLVENHAVPLVTVCVAFRGGASVQTPETAGLFHLYEHMMFNGNDKYPTKDAFTAGLKRMGTTSWNGATGREYINYYITVPSNRLEEAIDFWAHAVMAPRLDPAVLENEKKVVLNEIRGYHADPAQIAINALESRMFHEYPWRKNIDGPEYNIEKATVAQLAWIRDTWFVPSNMALMVGGDATLSQVLDIAEKAFGSWQGRPVPPIAEPPHSSVPGGIRLVSIEDQYYRGIAQVQFRWRGPDVTRSTFDTYVSDVFLFLLSSPSGPFKSSLMRTVFGLYDPEYIDFSYPTARDGANYIFSTYMLVQKPDQEEPLLKRVEDLRQKLRSEFEKIAADPESYFGAEALEEAKTKLVDQNIYALESAGSFVTSTLTFWWAVAGTDYFFDYETNCRKVSWDDISRLIRTYLVGEKQSAALVRVRTSTFSADPRGEAVRADLGYLKVNSTNAFWWQQQ